MIIAGFAGVGKTTYCRKYPNKAIDFICMPYKYSNVNEIADKCNGESIKARNDLEYVYDWQYKYYEDLIECEKKNPNKYIFVPTECLVLEWLSKDKMEHIIVYPDESLCEEYRKRYLARGNSSDFINVFIGRWDYWMEMLQEFSSSQSIILKSGEYVADVLK